MSFKSKFAIISAAMLMALFARPAGHALATVSPLQGEVGTLAAIERVDETLCEGSAAGICAFEAARRGLERLRYCMEHFRCVGASGLPDIRIIPRYEPLTQHDPGPVLLIEARSLRCAINPRTELGLVDISSLRESCSRLGWKCDIVWVSDEDRTTAFIGAFREAHGR